MTDRELMQQPQRTHWEGCEEVHPECRKPRREWVGLTDEERRACAQSPFVWENYLAIEAKLKEKNT